MSQVTKKMPRAAVRPHRPIPPRTATAEEVEDVNNMCTWAIVLSVLSLSLAVSVTSAIACAGLALS